MIRLPCDPDHLFTAALLIAAISCLATVLALTIMFIGGF